ncbi:MAG TPA: surface-adhesin E family protein [Novimethylophilus sp.]|jgi:hypothetical protein|uniref:surface-adhesin E family protein n=1 Tax=Novimethylophilus sp. TaxID=2137426 RepID=UPI002F406559
MRKIVWLLVMLISQPIYAAEWALLPDAGLADQYFYDKSKLVIKDEEVTYWKKVLFKTPQSIKGKEAVSGMLRERIHCGEHTAKLLSYLYYAGNGETLDYVAQDDSASVPIIPDTVGDAFDRVLCPLVWRKQEEQRIKAEQAGVEAELKQAVKKKEEPKPAPAMATPSIPAPTKPVPPQLPNVRLPEKQPAVPQLPMPQIMEQLY